MCLCLVLVCETAFVSWCLAFDVWRTCCFPSSQAGDLKSASKKVKFTDIKFFDMRFWLLCLTIMFFYNSVFPFVADARCAASIRSKRESVCDRVCVSVCVCVCEREREKDKRAQIRSVSFSILIVRVCV